MLRMNSNRLYMVMSFVKRLSAENWLLACDSLIKLDQFTRSVFFSYKFLLVLKTSTFVNEKSFKWFFRIMLLMKLALF